MFCNIFFLERIKKGGTIRCLSQAVVPPSTSIVNKYEQFTPGKDVNFQFTYSHNLQIGGFLLGE